MWEKIAVKNLAGANPTIASYNASVVNSYNATGSLACFENKNISFYFYKRSSLLQRWRCSCKFKNRRIGSWLQFPHSYVCTYKIKRLVKLSKV
jgi:hypothetical protein